MIWFLVLVCDRKSGEWWRLGANCGSGIRLKNEECCFHWLCISF